MQLFHLDLFLSTFKIKKIWPLTGLQNNSAFIILKLDGETFAGNMTVTDYAQVYINKTAVVEYLFFRKYNREYYHFELTSELMKEEQITLGK